MKNITKKWIELAEYDLKSAEIMLASRRYLYVTFMCQQAVEKYLKAYISEVTDTPPPYTHNLSALAETSGIQFTDDQYTFLARLTRYYINARYPSVKEKLSQTLDASTTSNLHNTTKGIVQCLKKELETLRK